MSIKTRRKKIKAQSKHVSLLSKFNPAIYNSNKPPFRAYGMRSLSDPTINYQVKNTSLGKDNIEGISYHQVKCVCGRVDSSGQSEYLGPGISDCKGNCNGTVCYHALASLTFACNQQDKSITFFDTFLAAIQYLNFGGKLVKIRSGQSDGIIWGVVK